MIPLGPQVVLPAQFKALKAESKVRKYMAEEKHLRENDVSVKDAWDQYQMVLALKRSYEEE